MDKYFFTPLKHYTGYQLVRKNYKWGLLDSNGRQLLDYVYDYISEEEDGRLSLNYDGHHFTVDVGILPLPYDFAKRSKIEGLRIARKGDKYGVIDSHRNVIIPIQQVSVREVEGLFWVNDNNTPKGKYWVYGIDGKKLSPEPLYLQPYIGGPLDIKLHLPFIVADYENGYRENGYNILDENFTRVLPFNYDFNEKLSNSSDQNTSFCILGLYAKKGYYRPAARLVFNLTKKELIDIVYNEIEDKGYSLFLCHRPANSLTAALFLSLSQEEKEAYVKKEEVIDIIFNSQIIGTINCQGYSNINHIDGDLFSAKSIESGKYGFIDSRGIRHPFIYDCIEKRDYIVRAEKDTNGVAGGSFDLFNLEGTRIGHDFQMVFCSFRTIESYFGFIISFRDCDYFDIYDFNGDFLMTAYGIEYISDGFIVESLQNKYGIISSSGKLLYPCSATRISSDTNGTIKAKFPDRECFIFIHGEKVVEVDYKSIERHYGLYLVQNHNNRWGVLDKSFKEIIPCDYEEEDVRIISDSAIRAGDLFFNEKGDVIEATDEIMSAGSRFCNSSRLYYGRKNSKGELITKEKYPQIGTFKNGYTPARNADGKWGLLDKNGDEVYPFAFSFVFEVYTDGFAQVQNEEGCSLVDKKGQPLFPFGCKKADGNNSFITPEDANKSLIITCNYKYGVMGPGYEIIVPCVYDYIADFGYYSQEELFKKGFLTYKDRNTDKVGLLELSPYRVVLPSIYDCIELFDNDADYRDEDEHYDGPVLFRCQNNYHKETIIDIKGETLYSTDNGEIKLVFEDFIIETDASRYSFIDDEDDEHHCTIFSISKKTVVARYQKAGYLHGHYLQVLGENGWGLFDMNKGKEAISCNYFTAQSSPYMFFPSEGLIAAQKGDMCGYIEMDEEWAIEPQFTNVGYFSEGFAAVQINGKWGYIDKELNLIIPATFDGAWAFSEGLALVKESKHYGYIDYNGKVVIGFNFSSGGSFECGEAESSDSSGEGYITKSGRKIYWDKYL